MCFPKSAPTIQQPKPAAVDNTEALQQADMEMRLRRRRRGAAGDVMTGPTGISSSSTPTLGGVAR